jgi:hypothetical protein
MIFEDLKVGNWRFLMVICSLGSLIVVYGMTYLVKESPRFLIAIEEYDEAINILNHIGNMNN